MTKNALIAATVLLSLGMVVCQRTTLQLGQPVKGTANGKGGDKYSLSIPVKEPNSILFLRAEATSNDFTAAPLIDLSSGDKVFDCSYIPPVSLCMVTPSNYKENDEFKIDVSCISECHYDLKAYASRDYEMKLQEEIEVVFQSDNDKFESRIVVPSDLNFTEIGIEVYLENPQEVNGALNLFVNVGDNVVRPTADAHSFKGESIWNDGLGVYLDSSKVKPKQNIQLLITGTKDMEVSISVYSIQNNQRQIDINQKIYDNVNKDNSNLYYLDLSDAPGIENLTIYMKLTQYSGKSRILVSPDKNFKLDSVVQGVATLSVTEAAISPRLRLDLGFKNQFYISVSGDYDSTYLFEATLDSGDYTIIDSQIAEMSTISGDNVDNYFYIFSQTVGESEEDNFRDFSIGLEFYTDSALVFQVRRCASFQQSASTECLIKNVDDFNQQKNNFSDVTGSNHIKTSLHSFHFRYDVRKCTQQSPHSYRCALQIVVMNPQKHTNPASYVLTLEESGYEVNLQEGVPRRSRIDEGQSQKYYFALSQVSDVEQVTFYLTIVSGDCLMMSSNAGRKIEIGSPDVQVAINDTVKYTGDISKNYYLKVQGYSSSYYTLTAMVKRKNESTNKKFLPSNNPLLLTEGIAQLFSTSDKEDLYFYIHLGSFKNFYVQTSTNKGDVTFQVRPSRKYEVVPKIIWRSEDGEAHISNQNSAYTDSSEFIVIVHSQTPSLFSIVYNKQGKCGFFNLGQAVVADLDESETRCFFFHLTKAQDVEIVLATSYFEVTTGNLFALISIGDDYKRQLSQRTTVIKAQELLDECPSLNSAKGNSSECILEVHLTAVKDEQTALVVQYIQDELQIFDGIPQSAQGDLSNTRGRYFYYNIDSNKPLLVSLKSSSSNKYRIVAKILSWDDYLTSTSTLIYPLYLQEEFPHADTTEIGTTNLLLNNAYLSEFLKGNSVLLISVYATSTTEVAANFNIQIIQTVAKLRLSETKQGFVDIFERKRYKIQTDGKKQLLVHLNSYKVFCSKLDLYSLSDDDKLSSKPIVSSVNGELIITPTQTPQTYAVEVTGTTPCSYQISYTPIDERIFELLHGLLFSVELKPKESAYFLYYHSRGESFRVVSMSEYGQVEIKAKSMKHLTNVSDVISNDRYEFGGSNQGGALLISQNSPYYCKDCYYLIQISTEDAAATSILVHSLQTPVSLRQNRMIRQTLNQSFSSVNYALLKLSAFKITTSVLYGSPIMTITNTVDKNFSLNSTLVDTQVMDVPYDQTTDSQYDNAAFLINVKCKDSCSFTLVIDIKLFARKLAQGLPNTLEVNSSKTASCVQFLSLEKNTSTYMHIATTNVTNLRYEVKCYNRENFTDCNIPGGKYVIGADKNKENLNVELKSVRGYYYFCLLLLSDNYPLNATVVHSENIGTRYITPNSVNLMNSNKDDPPTTIEMYNPKRHPVLVQVFECNGQVSFEATEDYRKFMENSTSMAEHSKTAGHYVIRFDSTDNDSMMVYARVKAKAVPNFPDATYMLTYSFFEPNKYPYTALGAEDTSIYYDYSKKYVTFKVKTIEPNDQFRILSYLYTIYISKDQNSVKAAVQCETVNVYTQSVRVGPNDAATTDWISFEVNNSDIKNIMGKDTKYYFVAVSCIVQVIDAQSEATGGINTYRFIYDNLQLSSRNPAKGMGTFKMKAKFFFVWILFPALIGLITFLIALKYCFKRVSSLPHSELIEQQEPGDIVGDTNTHPTTSGHLVGVSTSVEPPRRFDQK